MKFNLEQHGQSLVVSIDGSVDALSAGEMTRIFQEQVAQGRYRLVADLHQVDFMSSAGLRAILILLKEVRLQGGDFRLAAVQPGVAKLLNISGFATILQIFPDVEEAVDSFDKVQISDEPKS